MNSSQGYVRRRALGAALLLFVAGGVTGVFVDRVALAPHAAHAAPLTADGMLSELDLTESQEAHVRAVLDSLHGELPQHMARGPEALGEAAHAAQARIEAALPPGVRPAFRRWLAEHHDRLIGRMHSASRTDTTHHRE